MTHLWADDENAVRAVQTRPNELYILVEVLALPGWARESCLPTALFECNEIGRNTIFATPPNLRGTGCVRCVSDQRLCNGELERAQKSRKRERDNLPGRGRV